MENFFVFYENKKILIVPNTKIIIGRDTKCDIVLHDNHVSRKHASLEFIDNKFILVDLTSSNGTWVEGKRIDRFILQSNSSFRIANNNLSIRSLLDNSIRNNTESGDTMIFENRISKILEKTLDADLIEEVAVLRQLYNQKKEKLSELAFFDTLTGIYNRRYFDLKLNEEVTRAIRYKCKLSMMMVDIDDFKKFNDTYGHQKGDLVLAATAKLLRESLRGTDSICRYGGEEIVILLPETKGDNAVKIAEICRLKVEKESIKIAGVVVTVSIGVSEFIGLDTPEKLIKAADLALYQAKKQGKNQVVLKSK